jgi:centractin
MASQLLFETFNVPALCISIQAVLSLYASGRITGVVLDSGDGVTHAVPIYEGFSITPGIRRVDIGGRDVTQYLQLLLRKVGYRFNTSSEHEIVREIKEKNCFVSPIPLKEKKDMSEYVSDIYVLPDGNSLELASERYYAPEILFDPEYIGEEASGASTMIFESIMKCDLNLRRTLFSNITLSGGSTMFRGFGDRLLNDMKRLGPKDTKIRIYAPPERKYSAWIGGSILGSLSTFKKMWITAEEYQEDCNCIHKKFL